MRRSCSFVRERVCGEFGVVPPDTSHLNNDDFGAFIRGEMTKEEVEAKNLDIAK